MNGVLEGFRTKNRNQQLWSSYGITLATFERVLAEQGQCCACCGKTDVSWSWHVDHDHETELIRGILCPGCNHALGLLGDNLPGVLRAVHYLRAHEARGGYPRDSTPPAPQDTTPQVSAVMQRCYDLFALGASKDRVVIIMRVEPDVVDATYDLWKSSGGLVKIVNRHIFQIPKDLPTRVACSCGFEASYDATNPDSRQDAVYRLNEHLQAADPVAEAQRFLETLENEAAEKALAERLETEQSERNRGRAMSASRQVPK